MDRAAQQRQVALSLHCEPAQHWLEWLDDRYLACSMTLRRFDAQSAVTGEVLALDRDDLVRPVDVVNDEPGDF